MAKEMIKNQNDQLYSQRNAFLDEWVAHFKSHAIKGKTANYIPALGKKNSSHLGICIIRPDGTTIKSGDYEVSFTLQSISKVLSFIAA